jgi:hypothetical protein
MFIFSKTDYTAYQKIPVSTLTNPLTGLVEPMELVLYQAATTISTIGSATTYSPKPSGVYFTADGQDIPASKWTSDMELFFTQQKALHPVPKKGYKFSPMAKVTIATAIGFVLFGIGYFAKELLIEAPKRQAIRDAVAQPVQVGEQYNIGAYNSAIQKYGTFWVEVAEADDAKQAYKLCITGENSGAGFAVPDAILKLTDENNCLDTHRGGPRGGKPVLQFRIGTSTEWLHVKDYGVDKVEQFKRAPGR